MSLNDEHSWVAHEREGWSVCSRCGMVRNYDRPMTCRGKLPSVELRGDAAELSALIAKMEEEYSASRVGTMAMLAELHASLALMVRYLHEEVSQGDGISEEHSEGYHAAKSVLVCTAPMLAPWERAQAEVQRLMAKANEVPGLSATLDEARGDLSKAIELLHMLDQPDYGRHPDVAEFLDSYEERRRIREAQ